MGNPKRDELKVHEKKAVLAAVIERDAGRAEQIDKEHVLDELRGLVKTAGVTVVDTVVQVREKPDASTYFGKGKVVELKRSVEEHGAELVICDNDLSPAQGRNLEEETGAVIVDRSEVILDIFASRARTYEARLQVELAQLLYFRPRLKRLWTHLERIEGGVGAGRGPGEKQLETDRRLIDKRIAELKRKLEGVEHRRERTVAARRGTLTVSLVGYTNAGKSTLMNALTGAGVYVADALFATLDTRTRRWNLPHLGDVLLSDTVGFIRNLPHHLVASFTSTLEEARQAELLLHVVDVSHPEAERQIATVYKVLAEIGVGTENVLLVFNKIDALEGRARLDILRAAHSDTISVSAATGEGLERLAAAVAERLGQGYVQAEIETGVGNGRLFHYLAEHAEVTGTEYHDSRVTFSCRIPRRFTERIDGDDTTVRIHEPALSIGRNGR
ncbi:MAG: GTPase HflX [Planctomycetales bacterium]